MSAEAARIISKISGRKGKSNGVVLGNVKSVLPLTVTFDDVDFDVSSGLLVNSLFLSHQRTADITTPIVNMPDAKIDYDGVFTVGDRIAALAAGGSQYVILCKVVSV